MRSPLFQSLLISAALHLAVLGLVHPVSGLPVEAEVILNVRLLLQPPSHPSPPQPTPSVSKALPPTLPLSPAIAPPSSPVTSPAASVLPSPASLPMHLAVAAPDVAQPSPSLPVTAAAPSPHSGKPDASPTLPPETIPVARLHSQPPPPASAPQRPLSQEAPSGDPIDTNWYLALQVDKPAKPLTDMTPPYPHTARIRGIEGSVKLLLQIDELGRVKSAEVVESSPSPVFEEAALKTFRAARFEPAMKNGRPVRYQAYFRVVFELE